MLNERINRSESSLFIIYNLLSDDLFECSIDSGISGKEIADGQLYV